MRAVRTRVGASGQDAGADRLSQVQEPLLEQASTGGAGSPCKAPPGCKTMNERKTEDMVERRLRKHGYYRLRSGITIEKQHSDTPRIQKLLENASKHGQRAGKPEFLIRSASNPDFIIVIECKANPQKHVSATRDKYAEYAVDGVLLYASFLAKEFDVLAIAVSGQDEKTLRISHFFHLCGTHKAIDCPEAGDMVSCDDYHQAFIHSDAKFRQDYLPLTVVHGWR